MRAEWKLIVMSSAGRIEESVRQIAKPENNSEKNIF